MSNTLEGNQTRNSPCFLFFGFLAGADGVSPDWSYAAHWKVTQFSQVPATPRIVPGPVPGRLTVTDLAPVAAEG